jgi:signal transduction histidine kinase
MTPPHSVSSSAFREPSDFIDVIDDADEHDARPAASGANWRVLIVDDDPEVHAATRFALSKSTIIGRALDLLPAYSAAEGRDVLDEHPDVAVVLLDVVMESEDAGLQFVEWMRERGYQKQRIILRTGQPGYAPELDVIRDYDINDYRTKNELTQTRLVTAMTTAIRTFEQFLMVEEKRFELESFAYALAHDFRQTTRQIGTYSDLVARTCREDGDGGAIQALSYLRSASRRLAGLVDVMSQYTLLSRVPETETVELSSVFADVRSALGPVLDETGGELVIDGAAAGACRGHSVLMAQVLQILIANGLQHNDSPTPRVEVSTTLDGQTCTIHVRDNGVGVEDEYREKIFAPRMRLRASQDLPGTGLGLTMSRRAVESQGGAIWCESEPGAGSTFHVTFPVEAA